MEKEIIYTLFLDKNSIRNLKNIKKVIYKGYAISAKVCLAFYRDISNLIVIYVGDEDIKKIRQEILSSLEEDSQIKDIVSRVWVNVHNVPDNLQKFFIKTFNILSTNIKENCEVICDISHVSNISLKYSILTLCQILEKLCKINFSIIDGSLISNILYSYKVSLIFPDFESNIDFLIYVIKILVSIIQDNKHDAHILRMLCDKFEEFKYYLDTNLMFHALNIFRNLHDFIMSVLGDINDRDLRFLVENVIRRLVIVDKFDNVYSCVRSFVTYLSSFDKYVLPLCKFFIMYIVLKLLSECAYYGYIDFKVLDLDSVDNIFSNYDFLRKVIEVFNRGELKSLLNYVRIWEMCGVSKAYCRFIYHREVSEFGNVSCRGRINIDDVRRVLLSCVDIVEGSCYEYCEAVRDLFKVRR